ncbi:cysteine proteinase [Dendrothele bispora CBS 962.96]|uniref:Ubiquitin carboxyl-terminal hydrolase n=1 Tax=Dendrothele bispora (strain CBS 962.96) TaxID=1314807 RepID=A0A4V6T5S4_DENBC|nr:cysteine proteinase [Dendrothele bispora CBS 962.96]
MLVAPRLPQSVLSPPSEESLQYRPSKDLESFNSLLPPPVEFIEGSSTSSLAVAEGKYEPINATPSKPERSEPNPKSASSSSAPSTPTPSRPLKHPVNGVVSTKTPKTPSLFSGEIDLSWPKSANIGSGLYNSGNTCFLNSALQCLLHTPPLLHILLKHFPESCKAKHPFCMTCSLKEVAVISHSGKKHAFSPHQISGRLTAIAKHMRKGRQEDSHEFLRYAIDALQKACLVGLPSKIDPKLAETTWVHKIFGGRLRSRVTCGSCGHNSDTFDSILDLSIDVHNTTTLRDALRRFVAPDYLKGADKYKCEKCKKHVNAEKRFSIHDSPVVLTVQLKRFSPLGHKITQVVTYDESLNLSPYMSQGQFGGSYSLYAVICHAGGGPHSGHYYAFVKSRDQRWYEMNDESVTMSSGPPTRLRNAYILFYIRNKGQMLQSAVHSVSSEPTTATSTTTAIASSLSFTPVHKPGIAAAMKKKRPREEEGGSDGGLEDQGVKVDKPFIGPLLPSHLESSTPDSSNKRQKVGNEQSPSDPQASSVKKKIEALKATGALSILKDYASDGDGDDDDDKGEPPAEESSKKLDTGTDPASTLNKGATTPPQSGSMTAPTPSLLPLSKSYVPAPISPSRFFSNKQKQKHHGGGGGGGGGGYSSSPSSSFLGNRSNGFSPYARLGGGRNPHKYGGKGRKFRPI